MLRCRAVRHGFSGPPPEPRPPRAASRARPLAHPVGVWRGLQAAFAVLFILFRTFYWPLVSFHFWSDSMAALSADDAAPPGVPRAHSVAAYAVFLVANLGLTSLQLLWTTKIVRAVMGGDGAKKKP